MAFCTAWGVRGAVRYTRWYPFVSPTQSFVVLTVGAAFDLRWIEGFGVDEWGCGGTGRGGGGACGGMRISLACLSRSCCRISRDYGILC